MPAPVVGRPQQPVPEAELALRPPGGNPDGGNGPCAVPSDRGRISRLASDQGEQGDQDDQDDQAPFSNRSPRYWTFQYVQDIH